MVNIKFPVIILNFKNYIESVGENGVYLAKIAEEVATEVGVEIAICPQTSDIYQIHQSVNIPIFAQHTDANDPGSHTGNNLIEAIIQSGATGTLVNHSEHQLKLSDIEKIVTKAKKLGFFTCVCSNNLLASKAISALSPSACAMEPPELIGSGISVTTKPELVKQTIQAIKETNTAVTPLVGAGVSTAQDITEALQLGARGVLLASGYVKAKDPKKVLLEMANAMIEK
ncbi:MAG: triose-phosphate isomerase [Candidatus Heimdallarchaeota archaeon]|nr:triose-phosphate isomerase [Candidatus Heimdallarchaeota archaeon]